jgi:hypothetical protein
MMAMTTRSPMRVKPVFAERSCSPRVKEPHLVARRQMSQSRHSGFIAGCVRRRTRRITGGVETTPRSAKIRIPSSCPSVLRGGVLAPNAAAPNVGRGAWIVFAAAADHRCPTSSCLRLLTQTIRLPRSLALLNAGNSIPVASSPVTGSTQSVFAMGSGTGVVAEIRSPLGVRSNLILAPARKSTSSVMPLSYPGTGRALRMGRHRQSDHARACGLSDRRQDVPSRPLAISKALPAPTHVGGDPAP